MGFPTTALIVFEAYQRSTAMRFELGTIAEPMVPEQLNLRDLDPSGSVLFRLKLVSGDDNSGRIVGAADRLRPASDENEDGRKSLFPIDLRDLGPEVWKLDIGDAGPRLLLNYSIPGFIDRVRTDPLVQGLLLPAALRGVLTELARDAAIEDDDEVTWKADWLQFCREELRLAEEPSDLTTDEDRENWIADAVQRFCKTGEFVSRIRHSISEVA
ncbi:hypothetical protein [Phyllobacterium sophorae]|uniref:Uncharacterized protein n=1 Tax=Phyllobacterium sophorae TaxID=1520277 RepID=A0A2P7AQ17_9HYPH|nr:hypothetical protein [Phyllobacterium sophorae]PSH56316.1 hypothetical protein CU103_30110 [Phyllobacterium sophorae]